MGMLEKRGILLRQSDEHATLGIREKSEVEKPDVVCELLIRGIAFRLSAGFIESHRGRVHGQ